jgi:hypothetical protein
METSNPMKTERALIATFDAAIEVFWDVMMRHSVCVIRRFEGKCHLHCLQGLKVDEEFFMILGRL